MCLIVLSYCDHPGYRLIMAANRDEFYNRPTRPLSFWPDRPDILAGVDLKGGGTWLGVTTSGRFAAITNFRDIPSLRENTPTRGNLVKDFLTGSASPAQYLKEVRALGDRYNGFNLLVGDTKSLYYYSNKNSDIHHLAPGIYGLSNHLLNTPWPKILRAKNKFCYALSRFPMVQSQPLFRILQDTWRPPDNDLPDTGIGLEWERILSPMFIVSDVYGTRSSSVIIWKENGQIEFSERSHDDGENGTWDEQSATKTFQLQLDPQEGAW
jgi:uncharacterized protein with NRDE domain